MRYMIQDACRRLTVAFKRSGPETADPLDGSDGAPAVSPHPLVDFVAYAEDCVLSGRVRLTTDRMTDLLNEHEEIQLVDVMVQRLEDAGALEVKEVVIRREEILFVHATGPRGEKGRRRRTRMHPLAMQLGPYHIRGYLHALPGSPPLVAIRRRKPMVPLTEAWVEYDDGSTHHRHRIGAIVVNREQIDWIVPALEDEVEMPDLPLEAKAPPVRDFTGKITSGPAAP
jgi:hypothetical protein